MTIFELTMTFDDVSKVNEITETINFGLSNLEYLPQIFRAVATKPEQLPESIDSVNINDLSLLSTVIADAPYIDEEYLERARIEKVLQNGKELTATIFSPVALTRFITRLEAYSDMTGYAVEKVV